MHENNRRAGDEPEKYGEGSQVLKACKPPSLVEYQYAIKGGHIQVKLLENKNKKHTIGLCFCSKVKETIKRVKKEGLKKERNEVKESKR